MSLFITAFLASILTHLLVIRFSHLHLHLTADAVAGGPQKFHVDPVPRVGGLGVAVGLVAAGGVAWWAGLGEWRGFAAWGAAQNEEYWLLLLAAVPAFAGGLTEDVTKRVGPLPRLLLTFVAAGLGYVLLNAAITRVDIPAMDALLAFPFVALALTLLAAGGVAHAVNIIDGFNGLTAMVALIVLAALAFVAYQVGDMFLFQVCLATAGAIMGFLIWNYPSGLIFLGDGGAYLLGFLIAEISILLVARHPEVSAWFPLLLMAYPVTEVLFSVYRRKRCGRPAGLPDALHLHSLIYKRIALWLIGRQTTKYRLRCNTLVAPYLWGMTLMSVFPAVLFWQETYVLVGFTLLFVASYIWIYWRIVRFKTPRWLLVKKRAAKEQRCRGR